MAESIGLASGHPPAWFDTEDDGVGNRAGKVVSDVTGRAVGEHSGRLWRLLGQPYRGKNRVAG